MNKIFFFCLFFGGLSLNLYSMPKDRVVGIEGSKIQLDSNTVTSDVRLKKKVDRKPPLIIIDGIQAKGGKISDLVNKEDIHAMTIYRDIDGLVAKHGEKARHGIIRIITKEGHREKCNSKATSWRENNKNLGRKDIISAKLAFISTQLSLTTEEAEKFWPIYNERTRALRVAYKESKDVLGKLFATIESESKCSELEYAELVSNYISTKEKEVETTSEYYNKFKGVISEEQIAKLYYAEHQFKVKMLKRLKSKDADNK